MLERIPFHDTPKGTGVFEAVKKLVLDVLVYTLTDSARAISCLMIHCNVLKEARIRDFFHRIR